MFLFAATLAVCRAQELAPIGILRGSIIQPLPPRMPGVLVVKADDGNSFRCSMDYRTYLERREMRVSIVALQAGDRVEAVIDRQNADCYARTVKVVEPPMTTGGRTPYARREMPTESFAPRGYLQYSGLVVRVTDQLMILRTRADGQKTLVLRPDTKFFRDGQPVHASDLTVNSRVFVRAGHTLEREIEAYHVSWGAIINGPEQ
jgi:hypothetical protein